ncbi:MAG TPA: hypothetical protein VF618_12140 [Thermoanaerobaculia bacterium]
MTSKLVRLATMYQLPSQLGAVIDPRQLPTARAAGAGPIESHAPTALSRRPRFDEAPSACC